MVIRLAPAQLKRCRDYQGHFEKVEASTGVPWEAIAGIWYRESFSVTPPATPGGPFQFDPVPEMHHLFDLLNKYSNLSFEDKKILVSKGVNDFYAASFFAACHGRDHCNPVITPDCSDEAILDFFWGYNGKAKYQGSPRGSFYVYNGYDNAHTGLLIIGSIPDKTSPTGRKRIKTKDRRPGAFVVYKQLKGEL